MNLHRTFLAHVRDAVTQLGAEGVLPAGLDTANVTVEPPREAGHGDIATNAALVLAKAAGMKPRDIADALAARLAALDAVAATEVAGPGFLNLTLTPSVWHAELADILRAGTAYGDSDFGGGTKVNVEYVSANPTGPLHVAHARGAVIGDALAGLLAKAGFNVTTEYYVNDAGRQVERLGLS
ncbi:MAG: arginine--tRNA ligase, partial [Rhodospirillaceae bacterium]